MYFSLLDESDLVTLVVFRYQNKHFCRNNCQIKKKHFAKREWNFYFKFCKTRTK